MFDEHQHAARLQNPVDFRECRVRLLHAAQCQRHEHGIEAVVIERQFLGAGLFEREVSAEGRRPVARSRQHVRVGLDSNVVDVSAQIGPIRAHTGAQLQNAAGQLVCRFATQLALGLGLVLRCPIPKRREGCVALELVHLPIVAAESKLCRFLVSLWQSCCLSGSFRHSTNL